MDHFREAACCSSAVVQRAVQQKMICIKGVPGVTMTLKKAISNLNPTQMEKAHHVEAADDWCRELGVAEENCQSR